MKYLAAALALAGLAWLGMNQIADAQTATGYNHRKDANLEGYYIPVKEVRVGNFKLNNISISTNGELSKFEKTGKSEIENYAPVMIEFDDTTSPTHENELGQTYYERTERVLPDAYAIYARKFIFSGTGKMLGPISFIAKADPAKIKAARNSMTHVSDGAALIGTLKVGKTTIKNIELMWWRGE